MNIQKFTTVDTAQKSQDSIKGLMRESTEKEG